MADGIDNVANLLKTGNTKELSKLFAPSVEITIMDNENTYSQTQAAVILDKFLAKNKPKAVKLLHKVNSGGNYHFGVYLLNADTGEFRVAITLKDNNVVELKIEDEKVK
jgi:Na+-transporting NADH:ubiquinone oxidoreductase subunit NqrC